jgi:hypothetical protein
MGYTKYKPDHMFPIFCGDTVRTNPVSTFFTVTSFIGEPAGLIRAPTCNLKNKLAQSGLKVPEKTLRIYQELGLLNLICNFFRRGNSCLCWIYQ